MYSALLACVFAASPITESDWKSREGYLLAFRPMKSDAEGIAWYIRPRDGVAFRGWYQLNAGRGDYPQLTFSFVQKWIKASSDGWWFDRGYMANPYGVVAEAIVEEGSLVLTVTGIFEANHRTGALRKTEDTFSSHLVKGQVLEMAPATLPADKGMAPLWRKDEWKSNARNQPDLIFNTNFVGADLIGGFHKTDGLLAAAGLLSLRRSGDKWQNGSAWMIGKFGDSIAAGRGTFALSFIDYLDEAVLELSIGRVYQGSIVAGQVSTWKSISEEAYGGYLTPGGIDFIIPMYDRGFLLYNGDMYIDDIFFVNKDGKRTNRYYSTGPFGLFQEKEEQDSVGMFRRGWIFNYFRKAKGETRKTAELISLLKATPPPGFRFVESD